MRLINNDDAGIEEVMCAKCGAVFTVHPASNMKSPYIVNCKLHNRSQKYCEHEADEKLKEKGGCIPGHNKCRKCGEWFND